MNPDPPADRDQPAPAGPALEPPHRARPDTGSAGTDRRVAEEFRAFYVETLPKLAALVYRWGAGRDEAAESAHHALTEAARSWTRIENRFAWCATVALKHYHRRKFDERFSFEQLPAESPVLADVQQDVPRKVEARQFLEEVRTRIPELPAGQRAVFNHWVAGLSTKEIAEQLGCCESTVRAQLSHARRYLARDESGEEGR